MKVITYEMLSQIFERILNKLKQDEIAEITITEDLYRFIPTDEWSRFDKDVILTGSLYDDIDSLQFIIQDPEKITTYVDFDRTASLLRAISEKINPVNG